MLSKRLLTPLAAATALAAAATAPAIAEESAETADANGALVMFLTQTDPMLAGHGLHFAGRMAMDGRPSTIVLVGEAGRLALNDWTSNASAVSGDALQEDLKRFVDAGGRVYITPYTLNSFNASADALIDGVSLPDNPKAIHHHMFEPNTQMIVW